MKDFKESSILSQNLMIFILSTLIWWMFFTIEIITSWPWVTSTKLRILLITLLPITLDWWSTLILFTDANCLKERHLVDKLHSLRSWRVPSAIWKKSESIWVDFQQSIPMPGLWSWLVSQTLVNLVWLTICRTQTLMFNLMLSPLRVCSSVTPITNMLNGKSSILPVFLITHSMKETPSKCKQSLLLLIWMLVFSSCSISLKLVDILSNSRLLFSIISNHFSKLNLWLSF